LKNIDPGQRVRRLGTALFLLLLSALPVQARGRSEAWANTQFSNAQRMRETLNALPATERTRHEYHRVINAYRRVYYGAPASAKADPSAAVVADLLAEMGRCSHSDNDLRSAISQYKFLRREYPGSRNRFQALFNIAQIYQDDLHEPAEAKLVFEEFLRRYPHNHLADAARGALAQPVQQAAQRSKASNQADAKHAAKEGVREKEGAQKKSDKDDESNVADDASNAATSDIAQAESHAGAAKPAHITNIRHWSSPNNTRVAIDLEQDAKFESQRIDNPERIFFDLLNTNVVSSLLGKTIDVDDGLLKKIRVAQFQPGKSRIVLEVADRSDYETFLLTSPPRLIIDIHSKDIRPQDSSDQVKSSERNLRRAQGVQAASMKQPAPLDSGNGRIADDAMRAKSEDSPSQVAKLPAAATIKSRVPIPRSASVNGPKKTVVEADDSDDDGTTTTAKLEAPDLNSLQVKPSSRASGTAVSQPSKSSAKSKRKAESFPDVREASPTANGDRSLIRALGLKIGKIVIDPGHGGHDTGTIGPNGLEEKDLVLDVGRRLGKLLQTRLGADVVYTRKDDTFIPLETRTSIANQEQADLFVSIHANSSRDTDARGVETYYLNFTSSPEALDVAARENAVSDKSIHELQDLVKKIALKEKIEESREFASNVQRALHSGLAAKSPGIRDRGVKKAPFIVLIGANMPSILAEISFVSNPGDERRLRTSDYRQRIAESLYRGISKYVSGLSGVKVAAKIDKGEGQ
jgi:N-acetylmuramoyl-L-alanine amidase